MKNTLKKAECLSHRTIIEELFVNGTSFIAYPFRVSFIKYPRLPSDYSAQVLVSVSKKRFKRANKRNLIKRRMKEAYRLNKQPFYEFLIAKELKLALAFIYLPTEEMLSGDIEKGMVKALKKVVKRVEL